MSFGLVSTVAVASKAFFFEKKKQKTFAPSHFQRACSHW